MENASDEQLKVDGINRPLQNNPIAQFPSVFLRQAVVNDDALAVALPRGHLLGRHLHVPKHLEEFLRIGSELREKILWFRVFVNSSKPGNRHHRHHSWHGADLLPVIAGQIEGQRNAVTDYEPFRRFGAALIEIKSSPDGHHEGEQEQRKRNAQHRENAAPFIAKRILRDKPGQRHR